MVLHRSIRPSTVVVAALLAACARFDPPADSGAQPTDDTGVSEMDATMDAPPTTCAGNGDCADPRRPYCDTASGRCVECRLPTDRCPAGTYCDLARMTCAPGCTGDEDCERAAGDAGVPDALPADAFAGGDAMAPSLPARRCHVATHACVACLGDPDCPSGLVCMDNACRPGCNASHPCPGDLLCCGGVCADRQTDARNCGACGTTCAGATDACCAGTCQDTRGDLNHCGACGQTCTLSHALPACMAGACAVRMCQPGFENLDGNAANGCECETGTGGALCAMATMVPPVAAGGSADLTGVVAGSATEQWFRVGFATSSATLHITFAANPGGAYRFDLQAACGGATGTCGDRTGGATGLDDWSFFDTPGMHSTRNVPWPAQLLLRVYRTAPGTRCEPFVLRLTN